MIDITKLTDVYGYDGAWGTPQTASTTTPATTTTAATTNPTASTQTTAAAGDTFNFPDEWDQAGDVWSQMAGGTYSNQGMDWLNDWLGGGGAQGQLDEWSAAYRPAMMDDYSNMVKQMAEQAGVGGTRYSSGLQGQIGNYGGQLMNRYNSDLMNQMMSAMGLDVNTASGMGQLGMGMANTGAQGLLGLGGARAQLPLSVAQSISGIGSQQDQMAAMWAQLMNSALMGPTTTNQTYQPSGLTNFLGVLGQMPWGDIFGGGGDTGGLSTTPGASIW